MSGTMRLSCPGSLLISGEYRITEEGGRGIAVASGPLAHARVEPCDRPVSRGIWKDGSFEWDMGAIAATPSDQAETERIGRSDAGPFANLAEAAYSFASNGSPFSSSVTVDTSGFFDDDGKKKGFGSSAAACVLFCSCFSEGTGRHEARKSVEAAIRAHRAWQGGSGSGYDVLASAYGGAGCFTGGGIPSWEALAWPEGLDAWIVHAPESVKTPGAVARFRRWRESEPASSGALLAESDALGLELTALLRRDSNPPAAAFVEKIRALSEFGRDIGRAIGVPAAPRLPGALGKIARDRGRKDAAAKCLGAGDEIALLVSVPGGLGTEELNALGEALRTGTASPLAIRRDGLARDE